MVKYEVSIIIASFAIFKLPTGFSLSFLSRLIISDKIVS